MTRFLSTTLAALFCTTTSFAAGLGYNQLELPPAVSAQLDCPAGVPMLTSVYLGINAGYDSYRVSQEISFPPNVVNPVNNASGSLAGIFLGYGRAFNWFYLGGELSANSSSANTSLSLGTYQSNFNLRYSLGASLLPGIMVNHVGLVYARLGYVRSLMAVSEQIGIPGDFSITQFENGLALGVGVETALTYRLHLRLEVDHTQYGSFNSLIGTEIDPSNTQATLGLVYHFDVV